MFRQPLSLRSLYHSSSVVGCKYGSQNIRFRVNSEPQHRTCLSLVLYSRPFSSRPRSLWEQSFRFIKWSLAVTPERAYVHGLPPYACQRPCGVASTAARCLRVRRDNDVQLSSDSNLFSSWPVAGIDLVERVEDRKASRAFSTWIVAVTWLWPMRRSAVPHSGLHSTHLMVQPDDGTMKYAIAMNMTCVVSNPKCANEHVQQTNTSHRGLKIISSPWALALPLIAVEVSGYEHN